MLTHHLTLVALLSTISALPFQFSYTWPNGTNPIGYTICNSTNPAPICANFKQNNTLPSTILGSAPGSCSEAFPADLTVINSRYPTYNTSHLHATKNYFMLRRQVEGDDGEIATRVQFADLPTNTSNQTCRLEFILPRPGLQRMEGWNPTFDVYRVLPRTDGVATWLGSAYAARHFANPNYPKYYNPSGTSSPPDTPPYPSSNPNLTDITTNSTFPILFGTLNASPAALNHTRSNGGVAAVGEAPCNETMAWTMGMRYNGRGGPNYWELAQVSPPAWPVQGWRVVWGC